MKAKMKKVETNIIDRKRFMMMLIETERVTNLDLSSSKQNPDMTWVADVYKFLLVSV